MGTGIRITTIEIRTVENDPLCLRQVGGSRHPAEAVINAIWGYRRDLGNWPSLEQIGSAIARAIKEREQEQEHEREDV